MSEPEKIVRRNPRGGKSKPERYYFSPDTQDSIVAYQNSTDIRERERIYTDEIRPAFEKLVENLIFIHGFVSPGDSPMELKCDCVTFLYESLHKFNGAMGTKAFSYFNVVAKNWLIIRSKQRTTRSRRNVSLDELKERGGRELEMIERGQSVTTGTEPDEEPSVLMARVLGEIKGRLTSQNEIVCVNAIQSIMERIDEIDIVNKRAIFLYIREMTDLTPKQLSSVMSSVRKHYKEIRSREND
jgi:hypothetical protein